MIRRVYPATDLRRERAMPVGRVRRRRRQTTVRFQLGRQWSRGRKPPRRRDSPQPRRRPLGPCCCSRPALRIETRLGGSAPFRGAAPMDASSEQKVPRGAVLP